MPTATDRVTLLQFVTNFAIGGTERHVVNLGNTLDQSRFELHFACLKRWGEFLKEIEASRRPLTEYRINRLYNHTALLQQFKFAQYLRRHRIHIVHTYGFYPNVFAVPAARLAGVPVIVASIRDTGDLWTPRQQWVQKFVCRLADHIVVNADAIKQRLVAAGHPQERITVISNGIQLSRFIGKENGSRFRNELGLPPHSPLVAVLSRLNHKKGIEYFLEAAAFVGRRFPEARFLIVGEGRAVVNGQIVGSPYTKELESYAARLGLGERIVFTGSRLDVPDVLSEIAVSVLPSLSEGLSNTLLESMAAGVPVVATNVGGNPEVVEHGVTGFLVPPRDPLTLAHSICLLLENRELALRFGQAGRQRVVQHFSLEKMVRATEYLYLELLQKKRQGTSAAMERDTQEAVP